MIRLLAAAAATSLAAAVWQGILLAVVVALGLRLLPAISAAARSIIWTAAFTLAVLLHFAPQPVSPGPEIPALHVAPVWTLVLAALWLLLSLTRATQLILGALALRRLARNATPVAVHQSSRRYTLCTSPEVDRPSVIGFFRPRILLPPALYSTLAPAELHQVLLHETEHLRRRDDWTNLLQKLALVLFPLNPALLWIERRLCLERELACDDRVLRVTRAPKAYATCLTALAEHTLLRRGVSLALGILGVTRPSSQSELSLRVHRILRAPQRSLTPRLTAAITAVAVLTLSAGAFRLTQAPQFISFIPARTLPAAQTSQAEFHSTPTSARAVLATFSVPASHARSPLSVPHASHSHRDGWVATPAFTRTARKSLRRKERVTPFLNVRATTDFPAAPHFILARTAASQASFTYVPAVAIATPDGWLIIQL